MSDLRKYIEIVEKMNEAVIEEMPISTSFHGTPDAGSFRDDDRKVMASDKAQAKLKKVWRNSVVDFDVVYFNRDMAPEAAFDAVRDQIGPISRKDLKDKFGLAVTPRKDAITVIFSQNEGNERIPLTGWMIAHRFYHVYEEASRNGLDRNAWPPRHKHATINKNYKGTFDWVSVLAQRFRKAYVMTSDQGEPTQQRGYPERMIGFVTGTTKASRDRRLTDVGELKHEAFAQYLLTGQVRFNPPPERTEIAGRVFEIDPAHAADLAEFVASGETAMRTAFDKLLAFSKGKIFII